MTGGRFLVATLALFGVLQSTSALASATEQDLVALLEELTQSSDTAIPIIRDGFSGSNCMSDDDCAMGRICLHSVCAASKTEEASCDCESPECVGGEVCVAPGMCLSETLVEQGSFAPLICPLETQEEAEQLWMTTVEPDVTELRETIAPSSEAPEPSMGVIENESPEPSEPNSSPAIVSTPKASSSTPTPTVTESVSPTPSPSTPDTSSRVCVDAELLSEFAPNELAYETHSLAPVMCDPYGSCATKGHIVHYKGTAMMMGSYCRLVECEERIMEVNSPLRRRGLKVNTKSKDLKFTAYAARYETKAEEFILSTAVHIGL